MPGPLDNPRHERFAQLCATGIHSDLEAFQLATGADYDNAQSNAWRLKENEGVAQRIIELKTISAESSVLTLAEKREWLRKAVTTPIDEIDGRSPIAQRIKRRTLKDGSEEVEVEIVNRVKALELDAKLAGEFGSDSGVVEINVFAGHGPKQAQVIEIGGVMALDGTKQASIEDSTE